MSEHVWRLAGARDRAAAERATLDAFIDVGGGEAGALLRGGRIAALRGLHRGRVVAMLRRATDDILTEVLEIDDLADDPLLAPLTRETGMRGLVVPIEDRVSGPTAVVMIGAELVPAAELEPVARTATAVFSRLGELDQLRARALDLRRLVNAIPTPVLVLDGAGQIAAMNPAAENRLVVNERFAVGSSPAGLLHSEVLEEMLLAPEGGRQEVRITSPVDGSTRTYLARVVLAEPELGAASARVLTLEDMTSEAEMRKLKSDFVAVVGHELRTPLTLVKGYASTMRTRGESLDPALREKAVQSLYQHTVQLERLIEDLLLVAGIERGRSPVSLTETDLSEVVAGAVEAARTENPDREIILERSGSPITMQLDEVKVEQVLHHLIGNAVKFSDAPDPVTVSVSADDTSARIEVHDHGVGIYSGDLPKLFDRFHQVDGSHTRRHGGTGVGLYITKTLVEAHGGRVEARSVLGKGSTFRVTLPRRPASAVTQR